MYSGQIAKECGHSEELVNNVLVAMLVSKEYARFEKTNDKKHLKQLKNMIIHMICMKI